jgi:hypothetical protein
MPSNVDRGRTHKRRRPKNGGPTGLQTLALESDIGAPI